MKAIHEEMWLGDFPLRSTKKLDVHRAIHVNGTGRKVITIESIDVCCKAWYTIHGMSKADFIDKQLMPRKVAGPVTMGTWV